MTGAMAAGTAPGVAASPSDAGAPTPRSDDATRVTGTAPSSADPTALLVATACVG
jgi:hypothetical protein